MNGELRNLCVSRANTHYCGAIVNFKSNEDDCSYYFETFSADGRQCVNRVASFCRCRNARLESSALAKLEEL